jgi:XTP/dITP diphosphohydrolase
MKVVLATHNRDKIREIREILAGLDVDVSTVDDFDGIPEPVEDGDTLEANALKKAREIRDFTGLSALADDTGLEVDALGGAPGVRSARYAGERAGYAANCAKLSHDLEGVARARRSARFRTVAALALGGEDAGRLARFFADHPGRREGVGLAPDKAADALVAEGILEGEIAESPRGRGGFGYDALFVDSESGRTLAEMTAREKNEKSHRYRALVEIRELLLRLELLHEVSSGAE